MTLRSLTHWACSLLFLLFAFAYLYFQQGEVLALAQYVYSNGVTSYSLLLGAILIPLILLAVQKVVHLVARLPLRFHAWTYLPSLLMLAMLADCDPLALRQEGWARWMWLTPLALVVFIVGVCVFRSLGDNDNASRAGQDETALTLAPNFFCLLVLELVAASLPRPTAAYLHELETERLISQHRYADALSVGSKSLETTRRLTELRAFALSRLDSLPDRLFFYPQDYGADGLLAVGDTSRHFFRVDASAVCGSLGAACGRGLPSTERYLQLASECLAFRADSLAQVDTTQLSNDSLRRRYALERTAVHNRQCRLLDYRLCYALLRKDLSAFALQLPHYHLLRSDTLMVKPSPAFAEALPRAYREALALTDTLAADTATLSRYHAYRQLCDTIVDPVARKNYARRRYGDTYWWYYDFR